MSYFTKKEYYNESGYAVLTVIVLAALSLFIATASLQYASNHARTTYATKTRTAEFYKSETTLNRALSWLRVNSQSLITPYRQDEFYSNFEFDTPAIRDNEGSLFSVPTRIKMVGANNAAILSNDSNLATAQFPIANNIFTGSSFDAKTIFSSADLGEGIVRITVIDAKPFDPTKDYGPPPNPAPETDFYPIYRIDAMTDTDDGAHVYGITMGSVVHMFDYGIYGETNLELRQPCDSYNSSDGLYSTAIRKANCRAASNSTASVHKSEAVYGTLHTNGDITEESPYGGDVCSDFTSNCPNKGETCAGEDCGVPLLENFEDWSTYCPTDRGDVTYTVDDSLAPTSSDSADNCWNKITVNNGTTLVLTSTSHPYFIKTLELKNNSNSVIDVQPDSATGAVVVYVETIVGDKINGNQAFNTSGRPVQFHLFYLGTNPLTLNGNAAMNVALVAPAAAVTVSGSFEYSGALLAHELYLTGSGGVHYDESLGGLGPAIDTQYRLRELVQHYR